MMPTPAFAELRRVRTLPSGCAPHSAVRAQGTCAPRHKQAWLDDVLHYCHKHSDQTVGPSFEVGRGDLV
jgi:hypothetical protein